MICKRKWRRTDDRNFY